MNTEEKTIKNGGVLQFLKYAICAVSAGVLQIVAFAVLTFAIPETSGEITFITKMPISTFLATTIALAVSILWNFTANRKFTFKDAGNVPKAMVLAFLFYVPFYPLQTWWVHFGATLLPFAYQISTVICEVSAMVANFLLEFFWQKFVVFRKQK